MKDSIFIKQLKVDAIVGVYDFERKQEQPVIIDLELEKDIRAAAKTEDLNQSINYQEVAEQVSALVVQGKFQLVETMAEKIAHMILSNFKAQSVSVCVSKPDALSCAEMVGVKIVRHNSI